MDVAVAVSRTGGVARSSELREFGCSKSSIATAVAHGSVVRIRRGWFALPGLPDLIMRAHRVGGRPACASVADSAGLWMLTRPVLHVEVARADSRFRLQHDANVARGASVRNDVVLHWTDRDTSTQRLGQPLPTALRQMLTCADELEAVCAVDSAIHRGLVTRALVAIGCTPAAMRVLELCDERAESGTESVFRLRAAAAGFAFRVQVPVPGGRTDFLFGERLMVEVDGSEHHSGHAEFVADRERDAWHAAIGYYVVRLTYAQVVHRWHEVESLLTLLLARGEQLWPSRIRNSGSIAGS